MKEELQKLIEQYGADAVAKAAAEALNKHVPTINTPVVTDEQLINTISQLDAAVTDILPHFLITLLRSSRKQTTA